MKFEEYLMEKYVETEHPLDDMIPDGFADWIVGLDPQEIIDYAEGWLKEFAKKARIPEALALSSPISQDMNKYLYDCLEEFLQ